METYGHHNPKADDKAIVDLANQCIFPWPQPIAVEVGAWMGSTTILLADMGFRVFAVDHWMGSPGDPGVMTDKYKELGQAALFNTFCKNMGHRLCTTVFPLVGDSEFIGNAWPADLKISFLLVDGDHRYPKAKQDIELWTPHVAPGGIIAIHDYGVFASVNRAVIETGPFERVGDFVWWRRA